METWLQLDPMLEEMERRELAIYDLLFDKTIPPFPLLSPLPFTWPENPFQPVKVKDGDVSLLKRGADHTLTTLTVRGVAQRQQDAAYPSQADDPQQDSPPSERCPDDVIPITVAARRSAALPVIYYDEQVMIYPEVNARQPAPVRPLNREGVFQLRPAAPPVRSGRPRHYVRCEENVKGNWLGKKKQFYVKKPPNAFMLFMRDMRPKVGPEIKSRGSAAVNSFLGEEWKMQSEDVRAKYFEEADRLRMEHKEQHPNWSHRDNYGKKLTSRERRKLPNMPEDSSF